jgi:pimeloyl-ACP methyl ester carboxylesterase
MNRTLKRRKEGPVSFLSGGEGEPVLLLHGIPGSAYAWESVGVQLSGRYRVIIPDLLGFGESDVPAGDYYMESQASAIKELLDSLCISSLFLGGHDFGGPVALTLMRMFPELTVRRLVLSDTNTFTDTYIPPPLRMASIPGLNTLFFKAIAGNRIGMRMMYTAALKQKSETTWPMFRRHLTSSGMDYALRIFQRSLADLKTNYQAIEAMLPHISTETLILWGDSDPFFATSVGERMQRSIPGSTLKIYDQTGHFVPEEQPSRVANDIVSFFDREEL